MVIQMSINWRFVLKANLPHSIWCFSVSAAPVHQNCNAAAVSRSCETRHLCLWFPSFYSSFLPCELPITFYTLSLCCIIPISAELLGSPQCLIPNMKYCTVHPCKRPVFINQIFRRVCYNKSALL